jgi:hypothetical protein
MGLGDAEAVTMKNAPAAGSTARGETQLLPPFSRLGVPMSSELTETIRLHLPAGHKPGACAARDGARYCYNGVLLSPRPDTDVEALLCATDGQVLAVVPVAVDPVSARVTKPLLLPAAACQANSREVTLDVKGEVRVCDGRKTAAHALLEQEGRFPALREVFPKPEMLAKYNALTLDIGILKNLAAAVSDDRTVTLLIPPANNKGEIVGVVPVVGRKQGQTTTAAIGLFCPKAVGAGPTPFRQRVAEVIPLLPEKSTGFAPRATSSESPTTPTPEPPRQKGGK